MEILNSKQYHEFLAFFPVVKKAVEEWQLVTVNINPEEGSDFTTQTASSLIFGLFGTKNGCIFLCNDHELIMIVQEGRAAKPSDMSSRIQEKLPKGRCQIEIQKPTAENLSRFRISIDLNSTKADLSDISQARRTRVENVILIADDDMYMRTLIKNGLGPYHSIHEVVNGGEILAAYKKLIPDILFLDIHMPGKGGLESLHDILAFDPEAHVVMVSSDSSTENVLYATQKGARGFLAKPFSKGRLTALLEKCPTIR